MIPVAVKNEDKKTAPDEPEDVSFGPVIAIIIIVTLLVIGGLYMWEKIQPKYINPVGGNISDDSVVRSYLKLGNSNDLKDIKKDLSATSIQAIGQGLAPLAK